MTRPSMHGRWSPALAVAIAGAIVLAVIGLLFSRPDVVAMGLPVALWSALALGRGTSGVAVDPSVASLPSADGELLTEISVESDAEMVELFVVQSERRSRRAMVPGSGATVLARSRVLHSGPSLPVQVSARGVALDGAVLSEPSEIVRSRRQVAPTPRTVGMLPLPRRLTGLHGSHEGRRPGQGGDFRDIHAFAPGDELRRVDWRATARMARRPGDLLVRRTHTLSDASVVIAMDTSEDLGEVVASWGSGDFERSGVTSLDNAREAARGLAGAAIHAGDRVALHVLVHGGRSLRSGGGSRHLARLEAAIAATGQARDDAAFRRTPHVPHGSVVLVLSTFFQGAAAQTALMWRASGHRVVAIDVLPRLDHSRLTRPQLIGLRTVLAERENVFADLHGAGVDVVTWADDPSSALREIARARR
ncbi:DUF58 domain-containing protein [Microbacterium sp. Leaf159]|uniref:DUF58 domain-containing protein n=1 Tax=Microbacterium sp. Leaf159 TaxID=1736279 RepID=UPI000A6688CF|nr:DUF58 domain-containing protein [Microbacterium sp. Leaf159]